MADYATLLEGNYINGSLCPPTRNEYFDVINPATEGVLGRSAKSTKEDVDKAVAAAKAAHESWKTTSGAQRAVILRKIAEAVEKHAEKLGSKEAANSGKPLKEAIWDVADVSGAFRFHADLAEKLDARQGKVVDVGMSEFEVKLYYEPAGVAACIVPWNYPLLMATWKGAAAIAAGCCVVLKPSELTPYTALDLAKIAVEEGGLPPGVFNIVCGLGPDTGAPLAEHPDVDKVSFTGSVATGSKVMKACAEGVRSVGLELGGKSPILIFDDVDVDVAVEWLMFGIFWTNGQICSATSRALIHENIAPKVLARLAEVAGKVEACDPLTPEKEGVAFIGPLVSKPQYDKVLSFIEGAKKQGARVLCGGGRPTGAPAKGFYVAPTVLVDVRPDMDVWKEEIFGPVLSVMTFTDEEAAFKLADESWSGLAAAVLSKDAARGARLSRRFKTGIVWVNCSQPCFVHAPWGGTRKSGIGRDNGEHGFDSYLEVKQVVEYKAATPWGWYIPPGFTRPSKL